ncbi:tetratricopeptide repeat protein [Sphingomonas ginsenosidivorax]|uniref:Tetratricopeptide repeat protein n=1 Tax=Sphingomonas ginsenosidivorax TaxID=862135 RepID=A0A5C6UF55_9SPHN|nr:SPOR domain-containing protein [Sphingomonas ginsenosidivorax]TXC70578.1 tetratricopeptide repeat protein [Sphingomonas ginsenosidivorax]
MKTKFLMAGLSALVLGGPMVGCTANGNGVASASDRAGALAAKSAASNAGRAQSALAKNNGQAAIGFAESAVALMPRSAEYRQLLAQSYMQGGRFASATQAYGDVLSLSPGNGKAALNLALSQVATGDWQAARTTLATYAGVIPASDRGLALSLAGDTAGGIEVLTALARSPATTAKVRQNLALSFALAGNWQAARVVAAADMAPGDVDARLEQWAAFAQPARASDQVAGLLGVRAVQDGGQPVALALNTAPVARDADPQALAAVAPVAEAPMATSPVAVAMAPAANGATKITYAPRQEVVQALPAMLLRPAGAMKVALASRPAATVADTARKPATGNWFVQLGAFDSAGVAKDAWGRATRRFAAFAGHTPNGMNFRAKGEDFYRLSVGGFSRADADSVCRQYRARGGTCFVRLNAGDQMAQWVRKTGMQLASR